jgi:DNA-binding NarL/FixJ family response regulator
MPSDTGPIRVALVEDDTETRGRLSEAISGSAELTLEVALATGQEMLSWLESNRPDVLLVDLGLPDLPGLAVIAYCSQRHPRTDIMVVTMFEDEQHVIKSIEAGASGYLLKDSLQDEIVSLIMQLRAGGAPMTPVIARQLINRFRPAKTQPVDEQARSMLTAREQEVLGLIARGFKYLEIAQLHEVSVNTVHSHIKSIYAKLSVHSKSEAVFEASRLGLIDVFRS